MKKLYYIANIRIPTEKAHGIQIMNMCEAFADAGLDVELVVPKRKNDIEKDPFEYYGVKENFAIKKLWCLDIVRFGRLGFRLESFTFAKFATGYALFKKGVFYTRDELLAFSLSFMGKKVVWEAHMGHKNFFVRSLILLKVPIIVISSGLKNLYERMGARSGNILIAFDAVNIEKFGIRESKSDARSILKIDQDKKLAVYAGSLQHWKGTELLTEAAKLLPDVEIRIVSGKPHKEVPLYLRAADVLVVPNTGKEDISRLYTSPMKLFEYMASGVPIIAADLPSMREIVDDSTAYFFSPDDYKSLASTIKKVLNDPEAEEKGRRSMVKVKEYSWQNRAQGVLNFVFK